VFIGYEAGYNETGSNKLYIDNSDTEDPLIYGDFSENDVKINGDLQVADSIFVEDLKVSDNIVIEDNLDVGGDIAVAIDLDVGDDIVVGDDLDVGDDIVVGDDLDVHGEIYVDGYYAQGSHNYSYFKFGTIAPITGTWNASADYSIRAVDDIRAREFHAVSDQRIKTNFKLSEGSSDLQLINKIEVTDYTHIDTLSKGNQYKKGFIAQQVESIYPAAVAKSTNFIPDIYCFSESVEHDSVENTLAISLSNEHNLQQGDLLRFFGTENSYEQEVLEVISPTQFVVAAVEDRHDHMFIFGKQVDDFRSIDYDQVFSIGISAIQELSKQNQKLEGQIKKMNEDFQARISALEELVRQPNKIAQRD